MDKSNLNIPDDPPDFSFKQLFIPLTTAKAVIFIITIGVVVYANSLFNGFVGDDYGQIVENPAVKSLTNLFLFFTSSTFTTGSGLTGIYYKPITTTFLATINTLSGGHPFLLHLFQVTVFVMNSVLVFLIFKSFLRKEIAFGLSLVFLVHPLNAEVAEYISAIQDGLFFLFGSSALYLLMRYSAPKFLITSLLLLILSLFSKESGVLFALTIPLYLLLYKKRNLKFFLYILPPLLIIYLSLHYVVTRFDFLQPNIYHISRLSLTERLIHIPSIIQFYLSMFVFPLPLAISYDWVINSATEANFYFPLLMISIILLLIVFTIIVIYRKARDQFFSMLFFLSWFILGLLLHLQIIPLDGTVATRWFYFPIFGLLGIIGILIQLLITKARQSVLPLLIVACIIIISFSARTIVRNEDFRNNYKLISHDVVVSPDNFVLETIYGFLLSQEGKYDDAESRLRRAIELAPYYGPSEKVLGNMLLRRLQQTNNIEYFPGAKEHLGRAIQKDPLQFDAYVNLAYLNAFYEPDLAQAKQKIVEIIQKFPDIAKLYYPLAVVEIKIGNHNQALEALEEMRRRKASTPFIERFREALYNNKEITIEGDKLKF